MGIERVEALAGPQGTLYGSDAQAGTLRIITNKPVMNQFEAVFDGEVRGGSEGDTSYRGSLVFNVPLVEDKLALRVAGYSDRDAGFIDKAAAWIEYHRPTRLLGADDFFIRGQWSFTDASLNRLQYAGLDEPNPQFTNASYNIGDLTYVFFVPASLLSDVRIAPEWTAPRSGRHFQVHPRFERFPTFPTF